MINNSENNSLEKDLAKDSFVAKWPVWIRWLLFLPASIIGPLLFLIFQYIMRSWFLDIGPNAFYLVLSKGIVYGAGFILCGSIVAPKHQKAIAVMLLIFLSVFSGIGILSAIQLGYPLSRNIETIIMLIAGGVSTYYIFQES